MDAKTLKSALLDPAMWGQVTAYLDQLLDLEPGKRAEWLAKLADTDPVVADLLAKLLATPDAFGGDGLLESSPLAEMGLEALQESMVGKQIGGYTIEQLIGRGGMGAVWLASRSDGRFEGHCAIKFIDTPARTDLVKRFAKEGRLLARLSNQHIARLIDAGTTEDGKQFLVLEYVNGERIDSYCAARSLDVPARVRLFLDVVSAVAHAHSQLVIHRDLKPSNVLVSREGVVKLLDFGIAKLVDAGDTHGDDVHTRIEESALTPEYAAPEQLLGDVPSTATDVYQLGMLLYVLLTGGHPLKLSGTRAERIKAALENRIPLASESASGPLRKMLRGDLDAILAKAMDPEPRRRYPTAAALHEELERYLSREPVSARRHVRLYKFRRFVARHRVIVAVSATALVVLCAMMAFYLEQARVATRERDRAVALAARNDAVTDFLANVITEVADEDHPVTIDEMLERSERLAMLDTSANHVNRAAVLAMIASRYFNLGNRVKAVELLDKALQLLSSSPREGLRAELRCAYALTIHPMGREADAMELITDQLAHPPDDSASVAECLFDRAQIASEQGDADGTLLYGLQALDKLHSSSALGTRNEAAFLSVVAGGYRVKGNVREAMRHYELSLQKYAEAGLEGSSGAMVTRNDLAVGLESAGVPGQALQLYDDALQTLARRNPKGEPPVFLLVNRGRALLTLGRLEQSRASFEQGLQVAAHVGFKAAGVHCQIGLARIAMQRNDLTAADGYLAPLHSLTSPEQTEKYPTLFLARGLLELERGEVEAARQQFAPVIANKGSLAIKTDALIADADALLRAGDATAAARQARAAIDIAAKIRGGLPYSQRTGRASLVLGSALQKSGDAKQAHAAFETAVNHLSNTVDKDHPLLLQARGLLQAS